METPKNMPVKRLGRGLNSLISVTREEPTANSLAAAPSTSGLRAIPVKRITANPLQPRKRFDELKLRSLAESIARSGVLQPIVVRPKGDGFELVAGERRWRASIEAGIEQIPAIVREADEATLLELAVIENVQREDLNAVDRGMAYQEMARRFGLNHDEVAARVGEDRATVANYIRILDLSTPILEMVAAGQLSMGHARCLLSLGNVEARGRLAWDAVREGWSVRTMEERVRDFGKHRPAIAASEKPRPVISDLESRISAALGLRVRIKERAGKHKGRVVIDYSTLDDFERIVGKLGVAEE